MSEALCIALEAAGRRNAELTKERDEAQATVANLKEIFLTHQCRDCVLRPCPAVKGSKSCNKLRFKWAKAKAEDSP
jgi:hypothetical protein